MTPLTQFDIDFFNQEGYLVIPDFFAFEECHVMIKKLKYFRLKHPNSKALIPDDFFINLICDNRILSITHTLLGKYFLFHHINGRELLPTDLHKAWHHDFDGDDIWEEEKPMMIHFMIYPNGLKLKTGALTVLPKSHLLKVKRSYPNQFGIDELKGQVVLEEKKGVLIILNSALWHNRTKNISHSNRYYLNLSYCQLGMERPERNEYENILFKSSQKVSTLHQYLFQYK